MSRVIWVAPGREVASHGEEGLQGGGVRMCLWVGSRVKAGMTGSEKARNMLDSGRSFKAEGVRPPPFSNLFLLLYPPDATF